MSCAKRALKDRTRKCALIYVEGSTASASAIRLSKTPEKGAKEANRECLRTRPLVGERQAGNNPLNTRFVSPLRVGRDRGFQRSTRTAGGCEARTMLTRNFCSFFQSTFRVICKHCLITLPED